MPAAPPGGDSRKNPANPRERLPARRRRRALRIPLYALAEQLALSVDKGDVHRHFPAHAQLAVAPGRFGQAIPDGVIARFADGGNGRVRGLARVNGFDERKRRGHARQLGDDRLAPAVGGMAVRLHDARGDLHQLARMTAQQDALESQLQGCVQHIARLVAHLDDGHAGKQAAHHLLTLIAKGEDVLKTIINELILAPCYDCYVIWDSSILTVLTPVQVSSDVLIIPHKVLG